MIMLLDIFNALNTITAPIGVVQAAIIAGFACVLGSAAWDVTR